MPPDHPCRLTRTLVPVLVALLLLMLTAGCDDHDSSTPPTPSPPPVVPPNPDLTLTSPARIAPFSDDRLLVSDYETSSLYLVDKDSLLPAAKIKVEGRSTGIALAGDRIFVGNRTLRSVDVFDLRGTLLYRLGTGKAQFQQINDVAVDETLQLVYALDTKGKCVKRFFFDGSPAGPDIGGSILQQPTALAVDPASGNLLVSDFGNPGIPGVLRFDAQQVLPAVQIFSASGVRIQTINGATISGGGMMGGTLQTTFTTPQGLFIDNNHLYLVDSLSATIRVYNLTSLTLVKTFGTRGTADGELFYPLDLFVDHDTRDVYVTDNRNRRVTVFRGEGVTP